MSNEALTAALAAISNRNAAAEPAPAAPVTVAPAAAEPAPAEAKPSEPAPAEAAPVIPALDDLGKIVAARKAEREAAEAAAAEKQELSTLRAKLAEIEKNPKRGHIDPQALLADPLATLRAAGYGPAETRTVLKAITQGILSPDVAALQREVEQIRAKPSTEVETLKAELAALKDSLKAEQQQEYVAQQVSRYQELAADSKRFPGLAGLSAEDRLSWGDNVAARYQEAGITVSLEQIAEIANKAIVEQVEKIQKNLGIAQGTSKAGTNGAAAAPVSLTNGLAATATTVVPRTLADRIALATRQLEDARRNGG